MNLILTWRDPFLQTDHSNMVPLVIFREGLGGNYLKSLIEDSDQAIGFRIDQEYTLTSQTPAPQYQKKYSCDCAHLKNGELDNVHLTYDPILTIQVHEKIYHGIYNNFHKKLIVEDSELAASFSRWPDQARFWHDTAYYNIKEYHRLFQQDRERNIFPNVVDFDHMLEVSYIEKIFRQYLHRDITENICYRVDAYARLQLAYDLTGQEIDMQNILDAIPDPEFERTPWFAAYCIFKYELANHLTEWQRLWSIDTIDQPINKDWLRNISNQYTPA